MSHKLSKHLAALATAGVDASQDAPLPNRQEYTFVFGDGRTLSVTNENLRRINYIGPSVFLDVALGALVHLARNVPNAESIAPDLAGVILNYKSGQRNAEHVAHLRNIAHHASMRGFLIEYGTITQEDRRAMARLFPAHAAQFNPREGVVPASAPTSVPVIGMSLHGK